MIDRIVTGRVHSVQSMGALDGPGVRYVVFLQGCNLRCGCCHNPDTWQPGEGKVYTPQQIVQNACRYREYFGSNGGITLSGGEPLLQAQFARQVFALCRKNNIHTCLDTSGSVMNSHVCELLEETDRVLLDIKYTTDESYRRYVGCSLDTVLGFLANINRRGIPTTLRQVIIPTLNDSAENIAALNDIAQAHACVDGIELLPFRKMCSTKYDSLGICFPFGHLPEPDKALMDTLKSALRQPVQ